MACKPNLTQTCYSILFTSPVLVITASVNHDEAFFDNPVDFVAGRFNCSRHTSFCGGIHSYLALQLAKCIEGFRKFLIR